MQNNDENEEENEELRKRVKEIKAFQDVTYKELSEYMEMNRNAFYNWVKGYYNLGDEKQKRLKEIIDNIAEYEHE